LPEEDFNFPGKYIPHDFQEERRLRHEPDFRQAGQMTDHRHLKAKFWRQRQLTSR
jgi:hypothetical protein